MVKNNKIAVILIVLVLVQGVSGSICWLMFKEFFVMPTLVGSLVPALLYLRIVK